MGRYLDSRKNSGNVGPLIAFQPGYWTVEADGRQWSVSMTCIDPSEEWFVAGEWWHESHPMAQEEKERFLKWTRPGQRATTLMS